MNASSASCKVVSCAPMPCKRPARMGCICWVLGVHPTRESFRCRLSPSSHTCKNGDSGRKADLVVIAQQPWRKERMRGMWGGVGILVCHGFCAATRPEKNKAPRLGSLFAVLRPRLRGRRRIVRLLVCRPMRTEANAKRQRIWGRYGSMLLAVRHLKYVPIFRVRHSCLRRCDCLPRFLGIACPWLQTHA